MDENGYKEIISTQLNHITDFKEQLEQQIQDFHFDMKNKQMELVELQNRYADLERENKELRKIQLELNIENANLKDMVLDNGGDYTDV